MKTEGRRNESGVSLQVQRTFAGWSLYLRQPVLPASLAYIMLMFNAVLAPGGLMTAFLASRGLTGTAAALFRCPRNQPTPQQNTLRANFG